MCVAARHPRDVRTIMGGPMIRLARDACVVPLYTRGRLGAGGGRRRTEPFSSFGSPTLARAGCRIDHCPRYNMVKPSREPVRHCLSQERRAAALGPSQAESGSPLRRCRRAPR